MKGYGMIKPEEPGWIEVDRPTAGPLDAIIKPIAVAPCSSDTHVMHGGAGPIENRVLGHEAIGEVVEVGENVKKFKPGDKVIVICVTPDWEEYDMQTKGANTAHDQDLMTSFKFVLAKDGVFGEVFHVNNADANLIHLPEDVDVADALAIVDMMSTGFYGVEMADVQFGDSVVVFGIGPVGLMAVAGAKLRGAGRLFATGTRPECVELAKEYGATDIISYKDGNTVEQILEKNGGQVDCVIIAGGNGKTMNEALALIKNNGRIGNVNFFDITDTFEIPAYEWGLGMADKTIRGGMCPGGAQRAQRMLNIIQAGRFSPGKIFNKEYHGFDEIEEAFKIMDEKPRDLIKPIVYLD